MTSLRSFKVFTIFSIMFLSSSFFCSSQVIFWNHKQAEAFRIAQEQDKFILLFVGRPNCAICQRTSDMLSTNYFYTLEGPNTMAGPLKSVVDKNYSPWYSYRDNYDNQVEVSVYTEEILKVAKTLPLVFIINPDDPGKVVKSFWGAQTVEQLEAFLTINLLSGSNLNWNKDAETVFNLAKEQKKYIFKLEGKGTSHFSHQVMKLLHADPLKKLLDNNFILWYSEFDPDMHNATSTGDENKPISAPYISIIYQEEPDNMLDAIWGYQDAETLEAILKSFPVSNGITASDNHVSVSGNVLHLSNQIQYEQIQVFTLTGQRIANIQKNECAIKIDASYFPKGALVVYSSSGWSKKIVVK